MHLDSSVSSLLPGYARVLLKKGLNLQQGQILVIAAPVEAHDFVTILTREAYEAGARQVVMNWRSDASARLRYEYEDLSEFTTMPDWRRDFSLCYYRQNAAFLSLISANPYLMKGIDMQKLVAWQKASNKALKEYIDGMMASRTTWLVAAVPSLVWAHILYTDQPEETAYEMLWKQILQSSRADGENPLADWDAHLLELKKRRDWMTSQHFTSLHYTSGQGTDLTIGLSEKHIWQGGAEETTSHILFNANIPTEEIYTAPDASRVNGIVYSTRPLVYNGNLIDNFHITFKDGHAIESKAETGDDVLKQILSMDEGASRLGEVALIPYHSPISLSHILFYETLFDENASCHLAFGKAYPTCLSGGSGMDDQELRAHGLNDSMIHVDFMVGSDDLSIMGTKADGTTVPVFINGDWA